jgi:Fe-Mn family superoxide dismutase
MAFTLPKLPYALDALAPHISRDTLEVHHGKHHAAYVKTLNELVTGTPWERKTLEEIIRETEQSTALYNNAAQAWNHSFYWTCMTPKPVEPSEELMELIAASFGDLKSFKQSFSEAATTHFGSGWIWLVASGSRLTIEATHDAGCPIETDSVPLLACDIWEHAYYLDYQNRRADYVTAWWNVVDWSAIGRRVRERAHAGSRSRT